MSYHSTLFALADPTRRSILEQVARQPQSVADLAAGRPISRPAVSQHLRILAEADLVSATPQGARHIYALNRAGLDALRHYLDQFWTDALGAYGAEVRRRSLQEGNPDARPDHPHD